MENYRHPRVVVGVEDTLCGLAALRVAVDEARRRGVPLHVVHADTCGLVCGDTVIPVAFLEALGGRPGDVEIVESCLALSVRAALRATATDPRDLIVVGSSGKGAWHAFWSGSTARSILKHAPCPVLAVPAPEMSRAGARTMRRLRSTRSDVWDAYDVDAALPGPRPFQGA